ncbi:MAG: AAA family ATPase, partial [Clostridiales Family XIII bacterium]|nr:AAA family ATPase [Clostridiales Family XIII bacterium]
MGIFLNPSNSKFQEALNSEIHVDKSGMLAYINSVIRTEQKYLCISRPRRFGKSMAANMMISYYAAGNDSRELFAGLEISGDASFEEHLNKYNVIFLNMQNFLSK